MSVSRPVLRWHGGKWLLAPWIIGYFPSHQVYVEPFGGAGSVLMRKDRAYAEYAHEMAEAEHQPLLETLRALEGMVVLSGYPHPLYDEALADWQRVEREALADGARPRTEVLWINPACAARLKAERSQLELLDGAA